MCGEDERWPQGVTASSPSLPPVILLTSHKFSGGRVDGRGVGDDESRSGWTAWKSQLERGGLGVHSKAAEKPNRPFRLSDVRLPVVLS